MGLIPPVDANDANEPVDFSFSMVSRHCQNGCGTSCFVHLAKGCFVLNGTFSECMRNCSSRPAIPKWRHFQKRSVSELSGMPLQSVRIPATSHLVENSDCPV